MRRLRVITILTALCMLSAALCQAQGKSKLIVNLEAGKKQTVITYGTSLTAGGSWVRQLQDVLNKRYPGLTTVINSGKNSMWSRWGVDNLEKRVIQKKPDTVFLEFAINDAYLPHNTSVSEARRNLENMIDRILKDNPECEVILMVMNPPIGIHLARRPMIKDYYQMYRDVAEKRKLMLIDHYPKWEAIFRKDMKLFKKYVPDGIHPNTEGCEKVITPAILKTLQVAVE